MKKKERSFLTETFLFSGFSADEIDALPCKIEAESLTFEKGQHLDFSFSEVKKIAFVLFGECEVMSNKLVINTLKKGDSFGILSVFSDEPYPTHILARNRCGILFLTKETLTSLIECSPKVARNVITFLAGRVTFLNHKVATLGGASVEKKCASYLKEQYNSFGERFAFPISSVARKIGAGRASLYRALDALEAKEILRHEDGAIQILQPKKL